MKIVKTAKLKITSHTDLFKPTLEIYRKLLGRYIELINEMWDVFGGLSAGESVKPAESMTHRTKNNPNPCYELDAKGTEFYKFPSYLRRAAIAEAHGIVSSHRSRLKSWQEKKAWAEHNKKKFFEHPPKLQIENEAFPVFYKKEMLKDAVEDVKSRKATTKIKLYINSDWVWVDIGYSVRNFKSGQSLRFDNMDRKNASLVQRGKKFFLHIPFETSVSLNSTSLQDQLVIGVDLGLTNSAVVSAVRPDGTVLGRRFINQPKEKDRLKRLLGKLAKAKRTTGISEKPNHWRRINGTQDYIVQNTVDEIIKFANEYGATHIVMEHLGKMSIPKGFYGAKRLRFKLQFWSKLRIQDKLKAKAHEFGLRYSKVLARGTSMYAFDGSGLLERSPKKDIATFTNGKTYHCDLSASYSIASRYYLRELLKPLSETARLQAEAKVPSLVARTTHTLSSLIKLHEVLSTTAKLPEARIQDREAPSIVA